MKLQSQISRSYKGKDYKKIWVIIPTRIIKEMKLKGNEEVEMEFEKKTIKIKIK